LPLNRSGDNSSKFLYSHHYPDYEQNLISCCKSHIPHLQKIHSAHRQTDRRTDTRTHKGKT